jgi:hypothetical protein
MQSRSGCGRWYQIEGVAGIRWQRSLVSDQLIVGIWPRGLRLWSRAIRAVVEKMQATETNVSQPCCSSQNSSMVPGSPADASRQIVQGSAQKRVCSRSFQPIARGRRLSRTFAPSDPRPLQNELSLQTERAIDKAVRSWVTGRR